MARQNPKKITTKHQQITTKSTIKLRPQNTTKLQCKVLPNDDQKAPPNDNKRRTTKNNESNTKEQQMHCKNDNKRIIKHYTRTIKHGHMTDTG
ncbi:hypothetical protein C2G38_2171496 [Gigaspora rosea]|uniref:Uncharacterized protein n=1 Tax=Gigaspora rosea TaxID=44941 RepID=A0A397VLL8_9GLOM|nr:hypothetical protein C2G38_2171496 [Gigaspora rosea]